MITPEIIRAARDMMPNPDVSVTFIKTARRQPRHPLQPYPGSARAAGQRPGRSKPQLDLARISGSGHSMGSCHRL
jgi:hypothetical protein